MITHVKGDLLELFRNGAVDVILHVANCQGVMGSGIAAQIKDQYPEAYDSYKEFEKYSPNGLELGTISYAIMNNFVGICNLHAQHLYGSGTRFLNYEALYNCLESVVDLLNYAPMVIGIPFRMGSDRAGGDWRIVEKMIEVVFENTEYDIVIVEYNQDER